jgi:hypothetical protein
MYICTTLKFLNNNSATRAFCKYIFRGLERFSGDGTGRISVELCCRLYKSDILGVVQEILVVIYKMNICTRHFTGGGTF